MTFIDLFAGIGGFRRGMELSGHKCVGFCELDKFAVASYTSMHLLTDEQRKYLSTLPKSRRRKEILKPEYRNGEWYADDIRKVKELPEADCWCFGFPCQNISIAGNKEGLAGDRSGLFFEVMRLLGRPKYLFIENVKNLLSVNGGRDFGKVLAALDEHGYDAEWQVINSKDWVPQNRERVFIIGHLRGERTRWIFPYEGEAGEGCLDVLGRVPYRTGKTWSSDGKILGTDGIHSTLTTTYGGNLTCIKDGGLRKLTPRECFRLQGWSDEYYERAAFVNSDSQLYKQAGNGVTVSVIHSLSAGDTPACPR